MQKRPDEGSKTQPSIRAMTPFRMVAAQYASVQRTLPDTEELRSMRDQARFLTAVLASTSDAFIVADNSGRVILFNDAATHLFQIDRDVALNDNLFLLLDTAMPEVHGRTISAMAVCSEPIKNVRAEIVGQRDGRRIPVLVTLDSVVGSEHPALVCVIKDNSEVENLTRTDPLTGLANRREFDRRLANDMSRLSRNIGHVSLLFIDLDDFKTFNTLYGHQIGDEVLMRVGVTLRHCVRTIDTAARYGGEEFAVVLPATTQDGAYVAAERIRASISEVGIRFGEQRLSVTASIGTATFTAKNAGAAQLIRLANEAMLKAKRAGKNCTFVAEVRS